MVADGTVKVLDFGLAKAFEPDVVGAGFPGPPKPFGGEGGSRPDSMSPTITSPAATRVGMILGTAAYNPATRRDIWAVPLDGDRKPFVVVQAAFEETGGRFSRDGRWIAHESNETGRNEIYVRPFPGPGRSIRISINGGQQPRWRGDAREIFYVAPDNRVMAVPLGPQTNSAGIDPGTPVPLFSVRVGSAYDPSPDGQRFLLNMPLEDDSTPPITILLNWAGARR